MAYELKLRDVEMRFLLERIWFKGKKFRKFFIRLYMGMRNRYSTTISRRKNTRICPVSPCHRTKHHHQRGIYMIHRSCSVSGATKTVLYIMSCWNRAITKERYRLKMIRTVNCDKYGWNMSKHMKNYSSSWQRSASFRKSHKKYLEILNCDVSLHLPYSFDYWLFW